MNWQDNRNSGTQRGNQTSSAQNGRQNFGNRNFRSQRGNHNSRNRRRNQNFNRGDRNFEPQRGSQSFDNLADNNRTASTNDNRFQRERGFSFRNRGSRSHSNARRIYPIGFKTLESLLEREPYIIPLELLKQGSGYDIFLNDNINENKMSLILKLLYKSLESRANHEEVNNLLSLTFRNANFTKCLGEYIRSLKYNVNLALEILPKFGVLSKRFISISPLVAFKIIDTLNILCISTIQDIKRKQEITELSEIEEVYKNIQLEIEEGQEKLMMKQQEIEKKQPIYGDPPDSIVDHKPFPTVQELNEERRPFLRPNVIEGEYQNSQHYIDVQFRLLKEDFIRPLREGLRFYRNDPGSKPQDVRIYPKVKLHETGIEKSEIVYFLKLNMSKKFSLENSKRLMYGNVLCISSDNFATMIICSLFNRDKIKDHLIGVKIESEGVELQYDVSYTVLESKAYFVAYKHTLKALQKMDDVPLYNYLVKVDETLFLPSYILDGTRYKLCRCRRIENKFKIWRGCNCNDVEVSNFDSWPSCEELRMDESQRQALHGALTRQMAVIQGPPGTGKTYIGLQITEILLKNQSHWNVGKNPILVVCYTNHALDQFLEGILKFTDNIVRVGSRSKVECLTEYQISKRLFKSNRYSVDESSVQNKYFEIRKQIKEVQLGIDHLSNDISVLSNPGIISEKSLTDFFIIPEHFKKINMKNFLIGDFTLGQLQEAQNIGIENDNHDQSPSDDFAIEEEIRREDEDSRLLDEDDLSDDEDVLLASAGLKNLTRLQIDFHLTSKCLEIQIKHLDFKINALINENGYPPVDLVNEIDVLNLELRALKAGHNLVGTEVECKRLESMSPHFLGFEDRWKLHNYWKNQFIRKVREKKTKTEEIYHKLTNSLDTTRDLAYLSIMKEVDVVGMTTTGAAQYCHLLHDLAPPIVIVEEAAEIMEAHVVSALSTKCKHLILIGDHLQLRPKPNVYDLERNYNLSISLFERMIMNNITHFRLEYQHRMKPKFSELLVPTIYDDLKDHPSVFSFPKIEGITKDLFFLDHTEFENKPFEDAESFENFYEAQFLMGLCRHLIFQGYQQTDVTIITPYSGQFRCLKKIQNTPAFHSCLGVRIAILDNYQGEESNIILLSLVRSNAEEKVGFVKSENRVCVALSRARHGMYIIGNMSQIVKSNNLWRQIREKLVSKGHLGSELELRCTNHPDVFVNVKTLDDFDTKSPQGGCTRPCSFVYELCGHSCQQICHVINMDHKDIKCREKCNKFCDKGHPCPVACYKKCPSCVVPVEKTLPCSHKHMVPCGVLENHFNCPTVVDRTLPCGHEVKLQCFVDYTLEKCAYPCSTRLDCGHQCKLKCHVLKDPDHETYMCYESCEKNPEGCTNDHMCPKKCYEDCGQCNKTVTRKLKCGHSAKGVSCGLPEEKLVCRGKCKKMLDCGHYCQRQCGFECGGCTVKVEKVIAECKHKVKIECQIVPTKQHCKDKCSKTLDCGHQCKNYCRLPCTTSCEELVVSRYRCPRDHVVSIPCKFNKIGMNFDMSPTSLDENTIGRYCNEPCGTPLKCEHICKGKCGKCFNGRLHIACKNPCQKTLVCGHICKSPCSTVCPPCQEPCYWKCSHSQCKRKCGLVCNGCKERCPRACPHSSCKKKCGEKCNTAPCDQPCDRKLKCGHPCMGFCGEECPKLCGECDKEQVTEIFFGTEDEPDARFVMLMDCKHVFEASGLEDWMKTDLTSEKVEIGMKGCPRCRSPIYNTPRFHNQILSYYEDVLAVKKRHYASKVKFNKDEVEAKLLGIQGEWRYEVMSLRKSMGLTQRQQNLGRKVTTKQLSDKEIEMFSFQVNFLVATKSIYEKLDTKIHILEGLVKRVMQTTTGLSEQEMEEMGCELQRLEISVSVEKVRTLACRHSNVPVLLATIDVIMDPSVKFSSNAKTNVMKYLREIEKYAGSLGISESEKIEIVRAMGLRQGHWYKCPNGHIYCITECGGAVVEGSCPECGAKIGGSSHTLRSDNALASEMDGAMNPAWPTALHRY